MSVQIGKPNAGGGSGSRAKRNYDRLKQGKAIYRILPALGKLADKGVWSSWHELVFGYKTTEGYMRPFESCQKVDRKNKIVTVRDAARDLIEQNKEKMEKIKELLQKKPNDPALTKALVPLADYDDSFNVDKAHYVNALNASGEVTLLRIGYKEMLAFKAAREELQKSDGVDCVDVDGCYMQFSKSGTGRDTICQVTPAYEKTAGGLNLKLHSIDESELKKIAQGYFELDDVYPRPTPEEIEQMVAEGADGVDAVMEKYRPAYNKDAAPAAPAAVKPAPAKPKIKLDAAAMAKATAVEEVVEEASEEEAMVEEAPAPVVAKPATKVVAKPAAKVAAADPATDGLTEEEIQFMKDNGIEL